MTGNLRLDEGSISSVVQGEKVDTGLVKLGAIVGNGCRLGIHTTINPGVKIGSGTFVSSGSLLSEDIADTQFVRMKEGKLVVSENRDRVPGAEERGKFRKKM